MKSVHSLERPTPRASRAVNFWFLCGALACLSNAACAVVGAPIALHPDNPHYFLWQGRAVALITSGEHYGAVLNLDFDYRRYLDTLATESMMLTRTFSGTYAEPDGAFNIARNSLAPLPGRFIAPWARTDQPGYARGGNKFDLTRWNNDYFNRLHDYFTQAAEKGIIIEFTFFCPMYEDKQWALSPMNARNNINDLGAIDRNSVHTLDRNGGLLRIQEALVRKLVTELNRYDNVMFEICNEPYFGGVTLAWQHHLADLIVETERTLPKKHLITQNIANNQARITQPHPAVSVFNFHYATPPNTVAMNYQLNKVIGDNETGFRGTNNTPYRTEGWDFILAGGGLYNNLDYSFVAGHESGTFVYPANQPGGGNAQLRRELRALREFIHGFDLAHLRPDNSIIRGGVPAGSSARALVHPGEAIALYLRHEGSTGPWSARWTGFIEAPASGEYQFHTVSNDGIRLWVDGRPIIDNWTDHSEQEDTGRVRLEAGKRYPMKLEYFYNGGQGITKLRWTPPGGSKTAIPASAFRLPEKDAWGLHGQYFHGTDLRDSWGTRDDGTINFAWGVKPPLTETSTPTTTATLQLELPAGHWRAEWIDTRDGSVVRKAEADGPGVRGIESPAFHEDIALRLRRASAAK